MNICIINQWYPPQDAAGGVGKYNYYISNAYKKSGHEVFIISAFGKGAKKHECRNGINIYRLRQIAIPSFFRRRAFLGGFLRFLKNMTYSFSVRNKLIELDKKFKIDIVEYAEINAEGFIHSILGPKKIPFIVRCHTPYFVLKDYYIKKERVFDNPLIYWIEKMFIKRAHHLTTPSAHMANKLIQSLNLQDNRITVIPNAIDINRFFTKSSQRENGKDIKILYAGRMERGKGIFVLIRAITELARTYKNKLQWIFVGPGNLSLQGGTLENVEFKGEVSEEELINLYNQCNIFVNPSIIYESFSYTCLEAMACGKPVIASRIGGIPEVVQDGKTGFLFKPGNIDELIVKLKILIEAPDKREKMGVDARERVKEYFDVRKIVDENIRVYKKLCKRA